MSAEVEAGKTAKPLEVVAGHLGSAGGFSSGAAGPHRCVQARPLVKSLGKREITKHG